MTIENQEERDVQNDVETDVKDDTSAIDTDTKPNDYGTVDPAEFERTRKALEKANKEAQDRRLKLKEWEELQVDPAKVRELLDEQRRAEVKRKEEEGRYRELLEEIEQTTQSEILKVRQEADEKVTKMKSNLEKYFIDKTVTEALAAEGASVKLLGKHVRDQVSVIETEEGDFKTVVVDGNGSPKLKRGGAYMTVADLINEMKNDDEFARAFPAPKVSGNGTGDASSSGGKPNTTGLSKSSMTIQERAAFRSKYGVSEYNKLPD